MGEEPTQNLPQDGVGLILARLDSIDGRLTALEEKVDRRLQETRPIWEQVLVRLDAVEAQLVSFGGQMDGFERRLVGFEQRLVGFEQRLDGFEQRLDGLGNELRSSLHRFER